MPGLVPLVIVNVDTTVARADLADYARALTQANSDPKYGFCSPEPLGYAVGATVRVASTPRDLAPGEVPIYLLRHPDVAGALGYHDVDPHGRPIIKVFPTLEDDPTDLPQTLDHEVKEYLADAFCTTCIVGPDGKCRAREPGDPVETGSWELTLASGRKVKMTDWVTPAYFTGAPGKKNWLNTVTKVGEILPGGYQILWDGTQWTQESKGEKRGYRRRLAEFECSRFHERARRHADAVQRCR